jgi:exosome complex RNA-binding protein Rrp42 (RNase PH superfamily)
VIAPKQGDIVVTVVNNTAMGTNNSTSHLIQTIQSKLQRVLEENMDLEQLSIIERKIAYRLVVTVTILFVESIASITLFDACLVAAIAALIDTRIPTQPIINDGVLYTTTTTSMSKIGTGRNNAENDISITDAAARETCSDTKSLHMPIIPISITALGVRLPKSTAVMGSTNHDNNESAAAAKAAAKPTSSDVLQWLVDPTTDEQQQISDATIATIVINAAAIPNTTTMDDLNKELDQNKEDILCLQLNPHAATKTSSHVAATTSTVTTTTGVSWVDLENVIAIARRHVKSMYKLIKPK